jgi:hypothetical protein
MAQASGISLRSGQRIGDAHRLQPHRLRSFKRSSDPACTRKVEDSLGRQMDPPMHTVLLSIDKKCQIQVLGRTQPGLPQRHPRWVFHDTPTSASWLNATEDFVSTPTRRRLRRGMLQAAADPEQPTAAASTSTTPPEAFRWTRPADTLRARPDRLPASECTTKSNPSRCSPHEPVH